MRQFLLAALSVLCLAAPASAQVMATPGAAVVPHEGSALYRVDDGLFEIRENQTVDLTDQFVLFTFQYDAQRERLGCVVNGAWNKCHIGARLDFKADTLVGSSGYLSGSDGERFVGKDRCFLDVVKLNRVKGAPTTAVFRVHCF